MPKPVNFPKYTWIIWDNTGIPHQTNPVGATTVLRHIHALCKHLASAGLISEARHELEQVQARELLNDAISYRRHKLMDPKDTQPRYADESIDPDYVFAQLDPSFTPRKKLETSEELVAKRSAYRAKLRKQKAKRSTQ